MNEEIMLKKIKKDFGHEKCLEVEDEVIDAVSFKDGKAYLHKYSVGFDEDEYYELKTIVKSIGVKGFFWFAQNGGIDFKKIKP